MEEDANETSGDKPNTEDIKEEDASVDDEYFENGLTSVEAGLRLDQWVKGLDIIDVQGSQVLCGWRNDEEPLFFKLGR